MVALEIDDRVLRAASERAVDRAGIVTFTGESFLHLCSDGAPAAVAWRVIVSVTVPRGDRHPGVVVPTVRIVVPVVDPVVVPILVNREGDIIVVVIIIPL